MISDSSFQNKGAVDDENDPHGCAEGGDGAELPGQEVGPGPDGGDARLFLEGVFWSEGMTATGPRECPNADGQPVAGLACGVRELEHGVQTVPGLGESRCFQTNF